MVKREVALDEESNQVLESPAEGYDGDASQVIRRGETPGFLSAFIGAFKLRS